MLTLLASAYVRVSPGNADLVADMGGLGVSVLGRAAPRLASALRASPAPFVLMLDDLHELRSPALPRRPQRRDLGDPAGAPSWSRRAASSSPTCRGCGRRGTRWSSRASDLALDAAGAEQIFAQAHVRLSRETAAAVTERTEGWPVGIYLAAVIAHDTDGAALTVSGDDRYVADYLYRESLSQLPEATQRFLRRTAVLDQLCGPLCDAVLGESGAQEQLRRLEASNTFLIPLDRRREWYRYHALFREFLLGELRRVEPEVIPKLHLRAADWYEAQGSPAHCPGAPVEHDRAGPVRPAGDRAGPADLQGRPHVDCATVALGAR